MPQKRERELELLSGKILSGEFGAPGERFMTTRELMQFCGVSLVTAQRIMTSLKEKELVKLDGKQFYLSYGRIKKDSPLFKRRERSGLIGLHIVNLDNPYFSALGRAVEIAAHERGYEVVMSSSDYNVEEERRALLLFEKLGADGVISCPSRGAEVREIYFRYRLPFVFLSSSVDGVDADRVLINNYIGGCNVAEHFIKNGYEHFMYIAPETMKNKHDDRLNGFAGTLEKYGFFLTEDDIVYTDAHSRLLGNYVGHLLSIRKKPIGLFCYHDMLAAEAVRVCRQYGIAVPGDVGISGYDNLSILRDEVPSMTSVDYRINKLVSSAVELLIRRINGDCGQSEEIFIEPILTVRGSTSRLKQSERENARRFIYE